MEILFNMGGRFFYNFLLILYKSCQKKLTFSSFLRLSIKEIEEL